MASAMKKARLTDKVSNYNKEAERVGERPYVMTGVYPANSCCQQRFEFNFTLLRRDLDVH